VDEDRALAAWLVKEIELEAGKAAEGE